MRPETAWVSGNVIYRCLFALAILVCASPQSPYRPLLAWLILLSIGLAHLSFILSSAGLIWHLKSTPGHPILKLALLVSGDFSALALSISLAVGGRGTSREGIMRSVAAIIGDLLGAPKRISTLAVTHVRSDLHFIRQLSGVDRLTMIFGLLAYFALIRAITSKDSFKRNDDDYLALGRELTFTGSPEKGLEALGRIKERTWELERTRLLAYLLMGKFQQAKSAAMLAIRHDPDCLFEPVVDDAVWELFTAWFFLPNEARARLCASANRETLCEALRLAVNVLIHVEDSVDKGRKSTASPQLDSEFMTVLLMLSGKGGEETAAALASVRIVDRADDFTKISIEGIIYLWSLQKEKKQPDEIADWIKTYRTRYSAAYSEMVFDRAWTLVLKMLLCHRLQELSQVHDPEFAAWVLTLYSQTADELKNTRVGPWVIDSIKRESGFRAAASGLGESH